MINFFPKYIANRAIMVYIAALFAVTVLFMRHAMSWYWFVFGLVAVLCFFHFSNVLTKKWGNYSQKLFTRKLFTTALIIRVVYVIFSYWFYTFMTGQPLEFYAADSAAYHRVGMFMARALSYGNWGVFAEIMDDVGPSDTGFFSYLGVMYWIFGDSILIFRLIRTLLGAYMCVLVYKLAVRNFGETTGRMAAIFCMLMPNLIYYCGLHLKELEMVFLAVAFVERADYAMRSPKFTVGNMILPILLAGSLFFFRTVLGAAALFAFFVAVFLTSQRVMKMNKRIVLGILIIVTVGYFMGGRIAMEVEGFWADRDINQANSMEWRAQREGGNVFAEYAGAAIFAPLIFTIPFPAMHEVPLLHKNQRMIHGGNFVKNITSFFTILAIFLLFFKSKTWKNHILILTFTGAYLGIIALSAFAHSERFHLPALPFALILAAYGISQMTNKRYKMWFNWWSIFIFVACVGWNFFKLLGRGLV